ncbi:MAG: hypothetical protein AseanaTS_05650 [Candidatus Pelagadaptatus aseana]|uniref:DUF3348 family protein n=1 Tax=Candidatus Pelagadaptatus aseana TaxID=3120508 RepID=UPI0039B347A7
MNAPPNKAALSGTVLVRFLTSMQLTDAELSSDNFAERMSRLIGLSDSINIAQAHRNVDFQAGEDNQVLVSIRQDFTAAREAIEEVVDKAFNPQDKPSRIKLPPLKFSEGKPEVEPFQRFYIAVQREMDYRILPLWSGVRAQVAGASAEMAQLAAIDAALGESLVPHAKELFGVIPRLLGKRFEHLYQEYCESGGDPVAVDGPWIEHFINDMQELLFAELEVRLLPVIGLMEAVEYEVE